MMMCSMQDALQDAKDLFGEGSGRQEDEGEDTVSARRTGLPGSQDVQDRRKVGQSLARPG
jgi:hypothetical protein